MAWTYDDGGEFGTPKWIDYSDPSNPKISYVDPSTSDVYSPNMPMPVGGWTVQQLLSPNYFEQGTTLDTDSALRQALADVAPGYQQPATIDMNAQVPVEQQRAPAKDNAIEAALAAAAMGGIGYLSGGFGLNELLGSFGGDGLSMTTASGGTPTQVGGVSFTEGVTPGLDLGPNNLWSGSYAAPEITTLSEMAAGQGLGLPATGAITLSPGGGNMLSGGSASGGGAVTGAAGTTGGGATAGAGTAMSRILDGTATSADYLSLGGTAGSTLLGLFGSQQQTQAYKDLAQKYMDFGAPSRQRYEAAMSPNFDVNSIPGYKGAVDTASESLLRKLSATGGNPYGNPGGLIEANKAIINGTALPAYNEYARLNANTGFGSSMNAAVPFQTAAIGSDANSMNALGYGLGQLTQPPKQDLASLLKQYQGLGGMSLT